MSNQAHVTAMKYDAARAGLNPSHMRRKALAAWRKMYFHGIIDPRVARAMRKANRPVVTQSGRVLVRPSRWQRWRSEWKALWAEVWGIVTLVAEMIWTPKRRGPGGA